MASDSDSGSKQASDAQSPMGAIKWGIIAVLADACDLCFSGQDLGRGTTHGAQERSGVLSGSKSMTLPRRANLRRMKSTG